METQISATSSNQMYNVWRKLRGKSSNLRKANGENRRENDTNEIGIQHDSNKHYNNRYGIVRSINFKTAGKIIMMFFIFVIVYFQPITSDDTTMKPITAICIILSSIMIAVMFWNNYKQSNMKRFLITSMSAIIYVVLIGTIILMLTNTYVIIDKFFSLTFFHDKDIIKVANYMPSMVTLFIIFLVWLSSIVYILNTSRCAKRIKIISYSIIIICLIAAAGHVADIPALYFSIIDFSNGMAINTIICFTLIAVLLRIVSNEYQKSKIENLKYK